MKRFLYASVLINFVFALVQKPLIDMGYLYADGFNGTDGCGGVFFVSGAGNYVSASVSIVFSLYYITRKNHAFARKKSSRKLTKIIVFLCSLWHILFSDSKQILLAFGVAWLLLSLANINNIVKMMKYVISFIVVLLAFAWCAQNIEAFAPYTSWARPELYGPNGLAWYAKFYSIRLILSECTSPLNYLLGLGPGHTVSRLGAWFLKDYASLLIPLGSTTTDIGPMSRDFVKSFWLTSGSSLFNPIFGWAGIWGDLGLLGIGAYLYLGWLVWKYFCQSDTQKVILLSIFVVGCIFTQMEEPGYMISVAYILAISWQEDSINQQKFFLVNCNPE